MGYPKEHKIVGIRFQILLAQAIAMCWHSIDFLMLFAFMMHGMDLPKFSVLILCIDCLLKLMLS